MEIWIARARGQEGEVELTIMPYYYNICNHLHRCVISCLVWSLCIPICLVLNLTNCVVWCPPEIVIPSLPVIPGATFLLKTTGLRISFTWTRRCRLFESWSGIFIAVIVCLLKTDE